MITTRPSTSEDVIAKLNETGSGRSSVTSVVGDSNLSRLFAFNQRALDILFTSLPRRRATGTFSLVFSSSAGFGRIGLSDSLQYGQSLTLKLMALPQWMQILGGILG